MKSTDRLNSIGASDIGSITDAGFDSPQQWLMKKLNLIPDIPDDLDEQILYSECISMGILLEDPVRTEFERREKLINPEFQITDIQGEFIHPKYKWLIVHVDGLFKLKKTLVEIKCVGEWSSDEWKIRIPTHHQFQAQVAMNILGYERTIFAVLHGGNRIKRYELVADERLQADLIDGTYGNKNNLVDMWDRWQAAKGDMENWYSYLPPVDTTSKSAFSTVKSIGILSSKSVVLGNDVSDLCKQFLSVKGRLKDEETERKRLEVLIRNSLKNSKNAIAPGFEIILKYRKSSKGTPFATLSVNEKEDI